jgi:polyisoprenyl-phosphate glycosyltransferase
LSEIDLAPESGDFRLMDRAPLDALLAMTERNRFLRGMSVWVGFTQTAVTFQREPRTSGRTKYTLRRMLRFSFDAITSFSHRPLQFATLLGFVCSILAFVAIPLTVVARYTNIYERGVPTTIVIILLLGGIQLICVGIIGEYVGRIYDEVKRRPLYVVRDRSPK